MNKVIVAAYGNKKTVCRYSGDFAQVFAWELYFAMGGPLKGQVDVTLEDTAPEAAKEVKSAFEAETYFQS